MQPDFEASNRQVEALTAPVNVTIVGASDRPGSWSARVWANLSNHGYTGKIHLVNPKRSELFGQPCHADLSRLPEAPDHLAVMVPAQQVAEALRSGAAAGARSATIFAAGFGEDGSAEGLARRGELERIIAETGLAVSGPNVMGNLVGKCRLATLTNTLAQTVRPGPVALVGQSGGVLIHLNSVLLERGLVPGYVLCTGNEVGLSTADCIAYMAQDPDVRVVLAYVEGIADMERFKAACALVRQAGKSVVALKLGQSDAGQRAVLAHTGSLAGSAFAFDAVAGEVGVVRAENTDEAIALVELLLHARIPEGRRLGAITLSGAFRGMLLDAAEQAGVGFGPLSAQTQARLQSLFTVGANVSNPLDGGFGVLTSEEVYLASIAAFDADPDIDMILLQDELPRAPGNERLEKNVRAAHEFLRTRATKPIVFTSFVTHSYDEHSRALRAQVPGLAFLNEPQKSLRAIGKAIRVRELERIAGGAPAMQAPTPGLAMLRAELDQARAATGPVALDERRSKELLRRYGIRTPREVLARSPQEACAAATDMGYPVVLKVSSAAVPHKSDVGGVIVNLRSDQEVRAAFEQILANLRRNEVTAAIDGMLVCQQVSGGVELVLGLHRDPEMGLIALAGAGGVLLELVKDVALAAVPVTAEKAQDMLARTRAGTLLDGYRGSGPRDRAAAVDALVKLGRMATELGDLIESVDINPLVCLAAGEGATALDALVVLRPGAGR